MVEGFDDETWSYDKSMDKNYAYLIIRMLKEMDILHTFRYVTLANSLIS